MIRGSLSHVDLTVTELARSVSFYEQILGELGFGPLHEAGAGAPCWGVRDSEGGVFAIALKAAASTASTASTDSPPRSHDRYSPGLHHLAFHADSRADVDAFYAFLQRVGATVLDPPAQYDYTPGYYAVFFADPDGLKLEVVHEPALRGRTP